MLRSRVWLAIAVCGLACGESRPSARVQWPSVTREGPLPLVTTDLGYLVRIDTVRLAVKDLALTTRPQVSARLRQDWTAWIVSSAWAHPGHGEGGEVMGELAGKRVLGFGAAAPTKLGDATLLVGTYTGMDFSWRIADDGEDPELGPHSAMFRGEASRGSRTTRFTVHVDMAPGTRVVDAPFSATVAAASAAELVIELLPTEPTGTRTLFDLLDFEAADTDGDGDVEFVPSDEALVPLGRALQSHDFYRAIAQDRSQP